MTRTNATPAQTAAYNALPAEQRQAFYMIAAGVADATDRGLALTAEGDYSAHLLAARWEVNMADHLRHIDA